MTNPHLSDFNTPPHTHTQTQSNWHKEASFTRVADTQHAVKVDSLNGSNIVLGLNKDTDTVLLFTSIVFLSLCLVHRLSVAAHQSVGAFHVPGRLV